MIQKIETRNRCEQLRAFENESARPQIRSNKIKIAQPATSTQYLKDSIERLCARALAHVQYDLDATYEIELGRRLAAYAEGRASA